LVNDSRTGPQKLDERRCSWGAAHKNRRRSPKVHEPAGSSRHAMREVGPMADMKVADSKANEEAHWNKTTKLMLTHLGIWFFFGYVIHMFVVPLNKIVIPILGFPLGFYMAAQGSLIVFVAILFMFAKQQDKIDREHGYAEED
jgi:putative solute:sodium symporter small subunit